VQWPVAAFRGLADHLHSPAIGADALRRRKAVTWRARLSVGACLPLLRLPAGMGGRCPARDGATCYQSVHINIFGSVASCILSQTVA
jgi:hypothetical protein